MKAIVCGGRHLSDKDFVFDTLDDILLPKMPTIIHGGAAGADELAGEWAKSRGLPYLVYYADWKRHGKAAGPIRNQMMLDEKPDLVVAFPGGTGTADLIMRAKAKGVRVHVVGPRP